MADREQEEVMTLMREVLGEQYLQLEVESVLVEENVREQTTSVSCEVISSAGRSVIAGRGVGLVDALYAGVVARFAKEYPSLQTIRFDSFTIHGHLETKKGFAGRYLAPRQARVPVEPRTRSHVRHRNTTRGRQSPRAARDSAPRLGVKRRRPRLRR
jgi:hypothetical protein